jgi:hypothetical protein
VKALVADRPDLFYLEQGVIKLRKVANSLQASAATAGGKRHRHKK